MGKVAANRELQIAMTAAKLNNVPTPNFYHTHPPRGAKMIAIKWLMEIPVDSVEVNSSSLSAIFLAYKFVARLVVLIMASSKKFNATTHTAIYNGKHVSANPYIRQTKNRITVSFVR